MNISFESSELIRELKQDIAEFGKDELFAVWLRKYSKYGKEFIVNYDFIDEDFPINKERIKENERIVFMQADLLLSKLQEQNSLIQNDSGIDFDSFCAVYFKDRHDDKLSPILDNISNFRDLISLTGLNQVLFAKRYKIPFRTLQNWVLGNTNPPEWAQLMLTFVVLVDLGYLKTDLN